MSYLDDLFALDGRVAIITGGSSGIGHAIAGGLARAGAAVVLMGRAGERLEAARAEIAGGGARAASVAVDLADRDALATAAEAATAPFGEPDILVNAAGVNHRPPLADITAAEWDAALAVNLTAPFLLGQRFGPAMADRGWGRILNVGSQQTIRAFGRSGAYGVAKAGVAALTRSQAEAWSATGVCVNTLVPAFVRTPMTEAVFRDPEQADAMAARTMIGRNGLPGDLIGAAIFLCGPSCVYLTGQTIFVDGGFSVH